MEKSFKYYYGIFILFVFFLLIEGIFHHYYYKISQIVEFLPFVNQSGHNKLIWNENGIVENIQAIFLFFAIIYIFIFFKNNHVNFEFFIKIIIISYLFGIFYYFFEEISWGQHIFKWNTPKFLLKINSQEETNFHNISNLLNELPRTILLIWCSFSFFFIKIINKSKRFSYLVNFILPSKKLKLISILILIFVIPDLIVDKLDLYPGHPAKNLFEIRLNVVLDIITFNFIRLSELHELLFSYYILYHSYFLFKKKHFS